MNNADIVALAKAVKSDTLSVRLSAVEELRKSGDASAVPLLVRALQDREVVVCAAAVEALVEIGAPAVRAFGKTLAMENGNACRNIADALVNIGIPAVPVLVESLRYDEAQYYATTALREIGEEAGLPQRVLSCRELSPQQRIDTFEAMRRIGRKRRAFRVWRDLPELAVLCQQVIEEAEEQAREEARIVLNWLQGGNELLRASQRDTSTEAQELLRGASPTDGTTNPDELLRAGNSPEAETPLTAQEQKRRGLLSWLRRSDS